MNRECTRRATVHKRAARSAGRQGISSPCGAHCARPNLSYYTKARPLRKARGRDRRRAQTWGKLASESWRCAPVGPPPLAVGRVPSHDPVSYDYWRIYTRIYYKSDAAQSGAACCKAACKQWKIMNGGRAGSSARPAAGRVPFASRRRLLHMKRAPTKGATKHKTDKQ